MLWRGGCLDEKYRDLSKSGGVDRNTEWGDRIPQAQDSLGPGQESKTKVRLE